MNNLPRRLVAEALGTFLLVYFGCAAVIMNSYPKADYGVLGIAIAHGVILAIAVSATMNISGGHLNPAVTIALAVGKRITIRDAGAYVVTQLVGAAIAAFALKATMVAGVARVSSYGAPAINAQISLTTAILIEAILTFVLVSAVYGTAISKNAPKIAGFGIGLTLVPAIIAAGPLTGAMLNPARAMGPALAANHWVGHATWWVGPIVGAVLAALVWERVLLAKE